MQWNKNEMKLVAFRRPYLQILTLNSWLGGIRQTTQLSLWRWLRRNDDIPTSASPFFHFILKTSSKRDPCLPGHFVMVVKNEANAFLFNALSWRCTCRCYVIIWFTFFLHCIVIDWRTFKILFQKEVIDK